MQACMQLGIYYRLSLQNILERRSIISFPEAHSLQHFKITKKKLLFITIVWTEFMSEAVLGASFFFFYKREFFFCKDPRLATIRLRKRDPITKIRSLLFNCSPCRPFLDWSIGTRKLPARRSWRRLAEPSRHVSGGKALHLRPRLRASASARSHRRIKTQLPSTSFSLPLLHRPKPRTFLHGPASSLHGCGPRSLSRRRGRPFPPPPPRPCRRSGRRRRLLG